MIHLTASAALSQHVQPVSAEERAQDVHGRQPGATIYAVFSEQPGADAAFLGLVAERVRAQYPWRIFADLIGEDRPPAVASETSLDEVFRRMEAEPVEAIPVLDARGAFLGAISRTSLLTTLLQRERDLLEAFRAFESDQQRLMAWAARLEEMHAASTKLVGALPNTRVETDLLQQGLEALMALVLARYGAITILDGAGELAHFIHTGMSDEQVERIGALPQGRGLLGMVIRDGDILRLEDLSQDPRACGFPSHHPVMKSLLAVPIIHEAKVLGNVYLCDKTSGHRFTTEDQRLAVTFAHGLAVLVTNARARIERDEALRELAESREQLRALSAHLQSAVEEERARIAREIHDDLGQGLTGLKMDLSWMSRRMAGSRKPSDALMKRTRVMMGLVDTMVDGVRRIAAELRPSVLDDFGLPAAVEWQAQEFERRTGVRCEITSSDGLITLKKDVATALFRIVQETLTNVARHARATRVSIAVRQDADHVSLEVRDNGQGIKRGAATSRGSLGLLGMRERARLLGGWVAVDGAPGRGTAVTTCIPLSQGRGPTTEAAADALGIPT